VLQALTFDRALEDIFADIITALSRVRWLFVIARNSSFTYKGRAVDVKQVGRELGVRYVLEGSVRKVGNRVRITGQLIEASTGAHLWADRFDGDLADIFEVQDEVTQKVVGAIEPSLRNAEMERTRTKPTENLDAYDLYLQGQFQLTDLSRERYETGGIPVSKGEQARSQLLGRPCGFGRLRWAELCDGMG
jgi:TolB-like protein